MTNFSSIVKVNDFVNIMDILAMIERALYVLFSFFAYKMNSFPNALNSNLFDQSFCVFLKLILSFNNIFDVGNTCFAGIKIFSFEALTKSIYLLLKYKLFKVLFTK